MKPAAIAIILLALSLGMLSKLLIVPAIGPITLDSALLAKMAAMFAASALYLAFFLALGLLVTTPLGKTDRA